MEPPEVVAAGAVVLRKGPGRRTREVLLVHRPKYDDWSFPKGKVDPGEHVVATAVREVAEETGLDVQLGPPLADQTYAVGGAGSGRTKRVHWWTARVPGSDDVSGYRPNEEIGAVAWVDLAEAPSRLSHERDRRTLAGLGRPRRTTPLLVLRHGKARPRKTWTDPDPLRPLADLGTLQSEQLVPLLGAFGVRRVVSSTSRRCQATVSPFSELGGLELEASEDLSEDGADETSVARWVRGLLADARPAVLCTHRPVLPLVLDALGVPRRRLEPGSMLVAHHRSGHVVALEQHAPTPLFE